MVLEVDDCDEEEPAKIPEPPVTPQARKISMPLNMSLQTPDLSSRGPSTNVSPTPATPSHSMTTTATMHTIASLAHLPAAEIVKLASSLSATGLPLPKGDPLVVKVTDEFIDSLQDKPVQQQKQALGDKISVGLDGGMGPGGYYPYYTCEQGEKGSLSEREWMDEHDQE